MPQEMTRNHQLNRTNFSEEAVSFFHVETVHNAYLTVQNRDGQLNNSRDLYAPGFTPLVAIKISSLPDMLFLTTDVEDEQPQIWLEHYTVRSSVLSVNARISGDNGQFVAFEDPSRPGKHFTTRPFADGARYNPVVGDCHHVMRWEEFSLIPTNGSERLYGYAKDIALLCHRDLTASDLVKFIQNYKGTNLLPALDSLLPIVRWNVIEQVSERLLHNRVLQEKLSSVVPSSIWLNKALPELAKWERHRCTHKSHTISDLIPPQKLYSPADESLLAWSGADRSFAGFLHALTHAARRTIHPQRRVCMLSTIRNEGLYLLEWIAYHRMIGVEHFFIYSNDNTDKSENLLAALSEEGIITWIDNPTNGQVSAQIKAYGHALNVLPDILDFKWCFINDGDEFITLDPKAYPSLIDYLDWIEHWKTDAISLNWRFIASEKNENGLTDLAKPLTQRNIKIAGNGSIGEGWRLVKSACHPNVTLHSRPHHPLWNDATTYTLRMTNGSIHEYLNPPPGFPRDPAFADTGYFDRICISHYYFKSIIEWTWKHARNSGADIARGKELTTKRYNNQWANAFGMQSQDPKHEYNSWMIARQDALSEELYKLRLNPAIRDAENIVRTTLSEQIHNLWSQIHDKKLFEEIDQKWHFLWDDLKFEMKDHIPSLSHKE